MNQTRTTITYLILSAIGIALLITGSYLIPSDSNRVTSTDRLIVGIAFIFSCLLGLSMAFRPNWLKGLLSKEIEKTKKKAQNNTLRKRSGHHPECKAFSSHVVWWNNRTYCAGCLSLAFGAIIVIILVFLFIVVPHFMDMLSSGTMLILALMFIGFNFVEVAILNKSSYIHMYSNILLVEGFFIFVVWMFQNSKSVAFGLMAVIISFLLLDTRIQLSHWHHRRTCIQCPDSCKVYGA